MIGAHLDQMLVTILVLAVMCIGLIGLALVVNDAATDEDDYTL
jgi:hypothetical protein